MKGQKKLLNASVLIIGAGGLGAPAALYLAAAGVGTIGIVDADEVDLSNLQRQVIHTTNDLALLIQNMYTSTWWALIILSICLIAAFKLVGFYYRDLKFILISSYLWVVLLILAINIKDSFMNNISALAIFIPIIIFNFAAYINQKKLNRQIVV